MTKKEVASRPRKTLKAAKTKLYERQTTKDNYKVSKRTAICLGIFTSIEVIRQCIYQTILKQILDLDKILVLVGYLLILMLIISQRVLYRMRHRLKYYNTTGRILQWTFIVLYCGIISVRFINFIPNYLKDANRYDFFDFIDMGITLVPNLIISDVVFVSWIQKSIIPVWYLVNVGTLLVRYRPVGLISLLIEVVTYAFYVIVAFYLKDNFQWQVFLHRTDLHEWNKIHEEIFEEIPENIAVIDFDGNFLYQNQYFKKLKTTISSENKVGNILNSVQYIKKRKNFISLKSKTCSQDDFEDLLENFRSDDDGPKLIIGEQSQRTKGSFENLIEVINFMKEGYEDQSISSKSCITLDGKYWKLNKKKTYSMEIKISLFEEMDGSCSRLILILKDTTERDVLASLESTTKFKDSLLDSLSHEIRTPISGVKSILEASSFDENIHEETRQKFILPALRSAEILNNIVNDIFDYLQFTRNGLTINCQRIALMNVIERCYNIIKTNIEGKNIKFMLEISPNLPESIVNDGVRLRQVVLNLLSNAVRYTHEGSITLSVIEQNKSIYIQVSDTGRGMDEDAKQRLTHLLANVYKGEKVSQDSAGIGLGLIISHILASLLGPEDQGGLYFNSTLGTGSTFGFLLEDKELESSGMLLNRSNVSSKQGLRRFTSATSPRRKNSGEMTKTHILHVPIESPKFLSPWDLSSRPEEEVGSDSYRGIYYSGVNSTINNCVPSRGLHSISASTEMIVPTTKCIIIDCKCPEIMVVDDEPINILAFKLLIRKFKQKVDTANSGEMAVKIINSRKINPCSSICRGHRLIFMDLNMPGMDGFETTRMIRNMSRAGEYDEEPVIVACTAYVEASYKKKSQAYGMDDFVNKPLTQDKLAEVLDKYHCL